jgi:hypothetical protein
LKLGFSLTKRRDPSAAPAHGQLTRMTEISLSIIEQTMAISNSPSLTDEEAIKRLNFIWDKHEKFGRKSYGQLLDEFVAQQLDKTAAPGCDDDTFPEWKKQVDIHFKKLKEALLSPDMEVETTLGTCENIFCRNGMTSLIGKIVVALSMRTNKGVTTCDHLRDQTQFLATGQFPVVSS